MRWRRAAWVIGAVAVQGALLLGGCDDGVTPNCADAAAKCGPSVDGAADGSEASMPDSDADGADSAGDGSIDADAGSDANLDAGDSG